MTWKHLSKYTYLFTILSKRVRVNAGVSILIKQEYLNGRCPNKEEGGDDQEVTGELKLETPSKRGRNGGHAFR